MTGKLTIVPTPIGNLADMTARSLDALRAADAICAEDTRVVGKLLAAFGIKGKRIERLDENIMSECAEKVVARVRAGERIAYCSDAGMPGVSDPGLRLVRAAREADQPVPVEVLPGPTAVATAYVASGTTAQAFYFGGFFPRKDKARRDLLDSLRALDAALVFYESPHRVADALEAMAAAFPQREVAVCRELTKLHEEVARGPLPEVSADFATREAVKGEIVIVVDPPARGESDPDEQAVRARARELAAAGERPKSIAKLLVAEFQISRNEAYEHALAARWDTSPQGKSVPPSTKDRRR